VAIGEARDRLLAQAPHQETRARRIPMHGKVYHVFSRKLYGQIGREDLRNRRDHEFEYVQKRIGILDFVLSHPECQYLETEPEKVSYFCNQLGVLTHFLPAKIYYGQKTSQPTVRYFVDKLVDSCDDRLDSWRLTGKPEVIPRNRLGQMSPTAALKMTGQWGDKLAMRTKWSKCE